MRCKASKNTELHTRTNRECNSLLEIMYPNSLEFIKCVNVSPSTRKTWRNVGRAVNHEIQASDSWNPGKSHRNKGATQSGARRGPHCGPGGVRSRVPGFETSEFRKTNRETLSNCRRSIAQLEGFRCFRRLQQPKKETAEVFPAALLRSIRSRFIQSRSNFQSFRSTTRKIWLSCKRIIDCIIQRFARCFRW